MRVIRRILATSYPDASPSEPLYQYWGGSSKWVNDVECAVLYRDEHEARTVIHESKIFRHAEVAEYDA